MNVFCEAVIEDARLVREQLTTFPDAIQSVAERNKDKAPVNATTEVGTEAAIAYAENGVPEVLQIVSTLNIRVVAQDVPDKLLSTYESVYVGLFRIRRSSGIGKDQPLPIAAVAPYIQQTTWLAVRRAEGGLAATGIANLRLVVPDAPNDGSAAPVESAAG